MGCCSGGGWVAAKVEVGCHSGREWAAVMEEGGLLQCWRWVAAVSENGLPQWWRVGCRSGGEMDCCIGAEVDLSTTKAVEGM